MSPQPKYLTPATAMSNRLQEKMAKYAHTPYLKWWQGSYRSLSLKLDETDWDKTQLIYTDGTEVYCYINIGWMRPENFVDNISCINFYPDNKVLFATALLKTFKYIIEERNAPKIEWRVTIGNPVEESYDKFCKRHGGRIVGILKNHVMVDNRYYDSKLYEWINHTWVCSNCGHTERVEKEIMCFKCGAGEMIYKNPFNFGG